MAEADNMDDTRTNLRPGGDRAVTRLPPDGDQAAAGRRTEKGEQRTANGELQTCLLYTSRCV